MPRGPRSRTALKGGYSVGERSSETLGGRLLYVAVPIASGGAVHGAVRITYPTSTLDARVRRYWLLLAASPRVVLAAAALVGWRLARFVTRPLRGLEAAAAAVGAGDLGARAPEREGPPEVRSLARGLQRDRRTSSGSSCARRTSSSPTPRTSCAHRSPRSASGSRTSSATRRAGALPEVERLSDLVESLLVLARADAGAAPAEAVDTGALRARARRDVAAARTRTRRTAVAEVEGAAPVRAGPQRLVQVLDNLLANALEHAPPGTAVTVTANGAPPWVELRVRDEGPGMTDEQRARAFDRFWRAGSGPSGSGLGLAIVRKLVEADEGDGRARARPSGGTDALVRLRRA